MKDTEYHYKWNERDRFKEEHGISSTSGIELIAIEREFDRIAEKFLISDITGEDCRADFSNDKEEEKEQILSTEQI